MLESFQVAVADGVQPEVQEAGVVASEEDHEQAMGQALVATCHFQGRQLVSEEEADEGRFRSFRAAEEEEAVEAEVSSAPHLKAVMVAEVRLAATCHQSQFLVGHRGLFPVAAVKGFLPFPYRRVASAVVDLAVAVDVRGRCHRKEDARATPLDRATNGLR